MCVLVCVCMLCVYYICVCSVCVSQKERAQNSCVRTIKELKARRKELDLSMGRNLTTHLHSRLSQVKLNFVGNSLF